MMRSIKVRESLRGRVNQSQMYKDLTLTEKMDGEMMTKNECKKVLAASFDNKRNNHMLDNWVSTLRGRTRGTGSEIRTTCCE